MKKGDFETIRLPYFGKFSVNPNRVKHLNKIIYILDNLNYL